MEIQFKDVSVVKVNPFDVIMVRVDRKNMPHAALKQYMDDIKKGIKEMFPENKVMVLTKDIELTILDPN